MSQVSAKFLRTGTNAGDVNARAIPAYYTAINYTPVQAGSEDNDKISSHLKGIDNALLSQIRGRLWLPAFGLDGDSRNHWLDNTHKAVPSNTTPAIIPYNGKLIGVTFSNKNTGISCAIKIYKNGVVAYTWNFTTGRTGYITNLTTVSFNAGDRISVYIDGVTGIPINVEVVVIFQYTDDVTNISINNT